MLLAIFFYSEYFDNPKYAYHDESIFVAVMRIHKVCDFTSEIDDEYE